MKKIEIEILSQAVNCPVVQTPGRRFPGVIIQGDSLSILWAMAHRICEMVKVVGREELSDEAQDLEELLDDYLSIYEETLRQNGIQLPYTERKR